MTMKLYSLKYFSQHHMGACYHCGGTGVTSWPSGVKERCWYCSGSGILPDFGGDSGILDTVINQISSLFNQLKVNNYIHTMKRRELLLWNVHEIFIVKGIGYYYKITSYKIKYSPLTKKLQNQQYKKESSVESDFTCYRRFVKQKNQRDVLAKSQQRFIRKKGNGRPQR